jgi:hypothetical protein
MRFPCVFNVPYVVTNSLSIWAVWTPDGMIMPNHLINRQGRRVGLRRLIDTGTLDWEFVRAALHHGCRLVENSREELYAVARLLYERTSDCPAWRPPAAAPPPAPVDRFDYFQPYRQPVTVVEFPQHWPKP